MFVIVTYSLLQLLKNGPQNGPHEKEIEMERPGTESLYQDTEFGKWLDQMPSNVESTYTENDVSYNGTVVTISFAIKDEETA